MPTSLAEAALHILKVIVWLEHRFCTMPSLIAKATGRNDVAF
jgi:hypothetical protein